MNTAAIYRQYQTYVRSDKSGWELGGCSDNALVAQANQPDLHLEMCINRFDSGITLSRMRGGGAGVFPTEIHSFSHNCALFVMVSGQNRLMMDGREYRPSAGEIWLVRGELSDVSETLLPDRGGMCALHLDFSLEKLRRWHDEGLLDESLFSPQSIGSFALQRLARHAPALTAAARPLLQRPFDSGGFDLLADEAAALELSARLLRFTFRRHDNRCLRKRIDEAADILESEFARPLTIAEIARRVGLNECYLKRYFKAQTGETVAGCLRRLRLEHALALIESGSTVQAAMRFCGYRHAGRFNEAFRRRYGCLPSALLRRGVGA
ncbi:MAG: AraC family transcriptional regulator [Neisseria sp.]|nr:AraC family transcriptional regulator [Neisseria sp.]